MSAANCPETPRQKMIGMMYLILTCMLALNVAKEILNAFIVVNEGLEQTNVTFTQKNEFTYAALESERAKNPQKAEPVYQAAMKAKAMSAELDAYIKDLKIELIMKLDGKSKEEAEKAETDMALLEAKDNVDVPHNFLIGESVDGSKGKSRELKEKLIKYKSDLIDLIKSPEIKLGDKEKTIKALGDLGINTDDNPNASPDEPFEKHWETSRFAEIPAAAVITQLTQIQNQVKNAEATIANQLFSSIGSTDFKFDTIAPRVIPKSNYIVSGDQYEAELFIAAFSTTDNPRIMVGEGYDSINGKLTGKVDSVPVVRGVGKYTVESPGIGSHTYSAIIGIKSPVTGEYKDYPIMVGGSYALEYTVARPQAVISPTKMNVLYIGVDNPIDVSVPGFRAEQIRAGISQGSLSKGSQGYVARVNKIGEATISVNATDDAGNSRSMGSMKFRVKRVPDPVAKVAGRKGGKISKSLLVSQSGVIADLENFDFELKFTVKSFTVSATIKGFEQQQSSGSNRFTAAQVNLMNSVGRGGKVIFENIKASGPDGAQRELNAIVFKVD